MSIGYASKTLAVPGTRMRSITQRLATPERLDQVIASNLEALDTTLDYLGRNNIRLFRISSDIIPFGSSPVNTLDWTADHAERLASIGAKARNLGIRLSMHPGQYTVLNSPDPQVVERAAADLAYHATFLDALGMDATCKIVLHIGGAYGDKRTALERFVRAYATLPDTVKRRLVVENDDRLFTALDALEANRLTGAPVVFDVLHHELNHEPDAPPWLDLVEDAAATWRPEDGTPKIHYAQQAPGRRPGSHSDTIAVGRFITFFDVLTTNMTAPHSAAPEVDIMLEVKDKNLSALKCIACTDPSGGISALEREWARYKYAALEHDQAAYQQARKLLKDKRAYPALAFYELMESALAEPATAGSFRNAAQHVWGYLSGQATAAEHAAFARLLERFERGEGTPDAVKRKLFALAEKYNQDYLLSSYYFVL